MVNLTAGAIAVSFVWFVTARAVLSPHTQTLRELAMIKKEWRKPEICEVEVGMEVTSYQTAEIEVDTEVLF